MDDVFKHSSSSSVVVVDDVSKNDNDDNDDDDDDDDDAQAIEPLPTKTKTLTFVTGNKKKLEEVQQILSSRETKLSFEITNQKIDLPELQGSDPIEIAKEKCAVAARTINGPVFTEDTSLCFNALNSLPGPYVSYSAMYGISIINDIIHTSL